MRCPRCRSSDTSCSDFNGEYEYRCWWCDHFWMPDRFALEYASFFDDEDPEPSAEDYGWDY